MSHLPLSSSPLFFSSLLLLFFFLTAPIGGDDAYGDPRRIVEVLGVVPEEGMVRGGAGEASERRRGEGGSE